MNNTRPSPSKSATLYKVGTIKVGNDGNKWIIAENKNGVKKWQKYKIITEKKMSKSTEKKTSTGISLDMFYGVKILTEKNLEKIANKNETTKYIYTIIKTNIIPEINKLGIKTFIVPSPLSSYGSYWSDFPFDYIKKTYKQELHDINYMYFVFSLNQKADEIMTDQSIQIKFKELSKENKIKLIDIFEKYLLGYYSWNGSNNMSMDIVFTKNKLIKPIKKSILKENDIFPLLYIRIDTKINLFNEKKILNDTIKFFETTCSKYDVLFDAGIHDIIFSIYSFNDKKIIEKLKKFIITQQYITKSKFTFSEDKNNETNIWSYKL